MLLLKFVANLVLRRWLSKVVSSDVLLLVKARSTAAVAWDALSCDVVTKFVANLVLLR
jgi:hypothetical protein